VQGMQVDRGERLEPYVLDTFEVMYNAFERDRAGLPEGCLHEVKYEDLVADPVGKLGEAYEALDLGGFDSMRPVLETQAKAMQRYRRNRYQLDDRTRSLVAERWQPFFERYGYPAEATTQPAAG